MPKYKYNGITFSKEEVEGAAMEKGLSFEEYSSKFELVEDGVEEKLNFQTDLVDETATVGSENQTAVDTASPLEDGSSGSPGVDGKLEFPYEASYSDQLKAYEEKHKNIVSASNGYEYLQDKTIEEREFIASKFAIAPTRTIRILNEETQKYEEQPREDALQAVKNNLPSNFSEFNTPKEFQIATQQALAKSVKQDPLINLELEKSAKINEKNIKQKRRELESQYDLSDPEQVEKANKELNQFFEDTVITPVVEGDLFVKTIKELELVSEKAASEANNEYANYYKNKKRSKDSFLSAVDAIKMYGAKNNYTSLAYVADFVETFAAGSLGIAAGFGKSAISEAGSNISNNSEELEQIKAQLESGELSLEDEVVFGEIQFTKGGNIVGQKKGSLKEKIDYLEKEIKRDYDSVVNNVEATFNTEDYLEIFDQADLKDGIGLRDVVQTVGAAIPSMLMVGSGNPLLAGVGFAALTASEYGNNYYNAIVQGLQNDKKEITSENIAEAIKNDEYADKAIALAGAVASTGLERLGTLKIVKNTLKTLKLGDDLAEGLGSLYRGEIKKFGKSIISQGERVIKSGLGEFLTESAQQAIGQSSVGVQLGGLKDSFKYINTEEIIEAGKAGGIVGAILPFGGAVYTQTTTELRNAARDVATRFDLGGIGKNLKQVNQFFKAAEENLKNKYESGELSEEDYRLELNNLSSIRNTGIKIPKNFSEASRGKIFDLLIERNNLNQQVQDVDPALSVEEKARIEEINLEIGKISLTEKMTRGAVKAAEQAGIAQNIVEAKTTEEAKAAAEAAGLDLGDAEGVISADGKTIILDMQRAAEVGAFNVAGHELLHRVLYKTLFKETEVLDENGKPTGKIKIEGNEAARGLAIELDKYLRKIDVDGKGLKGDKEFSDRLKLYKGAGKTVEAAETLNLFADALRLGEIQLKENVLTKIGDIIRRIMQNAGFKKIKFKDGKDVVNFLKDYNRSIERGKLGQGIERVAKEGAEIVRGKDGIKKLKDDFASTSSLKSQTLSGEQSNAIAQNILQIKEVIKEGDVIAAKYNTSRIKGAKEIRLETSILEEIKPVVEKLVENRTKALYDKIPQDARAGIDRNMFKQSMVSDVNAMVINEYSGKQDIEKFIINRGYLRANSLAKRLGIEGIEQGGIKKDVTEQKDLMADETTVEIEKAPSKLINPTDLITNPDRKNKYIEAVKSKIKDLTPKQLSFKALKDLAPEVTAELFGVPLKKIIDATANLSKGDALNAQIFINKNAEKLLKLLPEGAVLGAASDKLIGTSTGVPRKLLEAFYEKQDRITIDAGLFPFVKKKNISKEDFLKAFGIVDGKKEIDFNTRSGEAQAIKGLMSMFGNMMTNTVVRQELSNIPGKEQVVQDIAAGKSGQMYSISSTQQIKNKKIIKLLRKEAAELLNKSEQEPSFNKSILDRWQEELEAGFESNLPMSEILQNSWSVFEQAGINPEIKNEIAGVIARSIEIYKNLTTEQFQDLVKQLDTLLVKEQKVFGFEASKTMLSDQLKNAKTLEKAISVTNAWIRNQSKSIRTFKGIPITTNKKLFEEALKPILQNSKWSNELLGKKGFKVSTGKLFGNNITFITLNGEKINSYYNPTEIKKDFENLQNVVNTEALEAGNYLKELLTYYLQKGDINNALSNLKLLTEDQSGLIRKLSKAGAYVVGLQTKDTTLEHAYTVYDTYMSLKDILESDSSLEKKIEKVDILLEKQQLNLVDKKIDKILNNEGLRYTGRGKSRMDNLKVKKALLKSKNEYRNLEKIYPEKQVTGLNSKTNKEKILDKQFNDILENKTGIASGKEYSDARAEVVGASKGKFNWFIPPTAEDFVGLLYQFLGKGKEGDKQMAWFKVNLLNPYARAMSGITRERVSIARNYRALKKELKIVPKNLKKKVPGEDFTVEQALRVHIWGKQGYDVPGLDNADRKSLNDYINSKPELVEFADKMILLNKDYAKPKDSWLAGTLTTDMLETLNTTRRAEFLKEWQENVDVVFSDKNLNKIEAAYGSSFRYALENILTRMKTGRNRSYGTDSLTGRVTDWLTNSIGAIMFFNTRSAVLQTLSAVNFINFGSNNILAAGKAFANQKQFWTDFKMLYNSDFLVDRRDGLRLNVNESDIADMAKNGGVKGVIAELLKLGFTPTQIADSFAISSGGATFYRNTLNQYLKEGVDPKVAEELAFREFREIAEESQQSSRPDRISAQQAGPLGRIILAFANTPAQYARLMKKAASDLKNGRGDAKTNVSKLIYYGVAQNLIFNAMQQALFAMAFGDDEEEEETEQKKYINIANGMADSILRGMGISGAIVSVLKNTAKKLIERSENKQPDYAENALMELLKISPPVSSKASKIKNALRSYEWDKDEMYEKGLALDNPAYLAAGNVLSAATNIPLDRVIKKVTNVKDAMDEDVQLWQRIAMIAGWQAWELGIKEEKKSKSRGSSFKSTEL
jgi:exonuclease VII small subunit